MTLCDRDDQLIDLVVGQSQGTSLDPVPERCPRRLPGSDHLMLRKAILVATLTSAILTMSAASAFAWNNGFDGDGYATHDWILENAIELAGESASWVDTETARLASDDPDTLGTSPYNHVFKNVGAAQGGPQQAADEYSRLLDAYEKGDYLEASRLLGVMSHYYSDVTQPFHSYYYPVGSTRKTGYAGRLTVRDIHMDYERAAWTGVKKYGDEMLSPRDRRPVTDVRSMAVSSARYARGRYKPLLESFAVSGTINGDVPKTITRQVLSRSVNDLADIIAAIPAGQGRSAAPASMKQSMSSRTYYYPRKGQLIRTHAVCVDAAGTPMEGVRVKFSWPGPGGTVKTYTRYTNRDGLAWHWKYTEATSSMRRLGMSATAVSGSQTTTSATWYMRTPVLAPGTKGVKVKLSEDRPRRGTVVSARVKVVNSSGKPVKGLPVTFTWKHKTGTYKIKAVTDAKGIARCSRDIGRSARGYRVRVSASMLSGGRTRSHSAYFTPR